MPATRWVVAVGCVLFAAAGARAADPPARNAALHYWQAFALMPGAGTADRLTDDERNRVEEWETAPIDDVTRSAVKKHADALIQLHRGAELPKCAWSIDSDLPRDGIGTRLPHVHKARELASAALLRARVRFADGEPLRAVDDLVAVVRLCRHLTGTGDMISMLAAWARERKAVEVFAANLWSVADRGLVRDAATKWDSLPPPRPFVEVFARHRDETLAWLYAHSTRDPDDVPDTEHEPVGRFVTLDYYTGGQTLEQAAAAFCVLFRKQLDRAVAVAALPVEKVAQAEKELLQSLAQLDPAGDPDEQIVKALTRLLLPGVGKMRITEAEMIARRAMLRAALAVAGGSPDRLKEHPDPFGDGPFEVRPVEGGYELKSRLSQVIGRPVTLVVRPTRPAK